MSRASWRMSWRSWRRSRCPRRSSRRSCCTCGSGTGVGVCAPALGAQTASATQEVRHQLTINQCLTCSALRRDSHTSSPDLPGVVSRATMRRLSRGGIHVAAKTPEQSEVLVDRKDAVVTLTFNRPEARNAMTWNMSERLYQTAEEVDADDSVRVLVLRGAGGKAFVAGTDISQFTSFRTAEDGIQYEREGERRTARLERVGKPVIAQVEGFAVGGGFAIAAVCDIRIATPESRVGFPIARTLGNCLSMENYSSSVDLFGLALVRNSNVPDNSVLHVTPEFPCIVGATVTIGHRCVVHACTIMDNVRIGIGAVVLTGAVVEEGAQVGAGALVPQGKVVPAGWLVMGVPAQPIRKMGEDELEDIRRNAREYLELWHRDYRVG